MPPDPNKPTSFGRSLQLSEGDLLFEQNDFAMIVGRDNFLQGMQVMIETPFATDVFNVNYGFDVLGILSSAQSVPRTKDLIRLNIVKSVSQDNRVREIKDVVFNDEPGSLKRRWQAVVVLQTITEGEVVLSLEGSGVTT